MSDQIKFDEFQLEYLRYHLAIKTPLHIIAQQYRQLYESSIKGQHIQAIQLRDKDIIREIAKKELSNTSAVPVSYSRVRLEMINRSLESATTPKVVRTYKVSEPYIDPATNQEAMRDVWKVEYDIDYQAIRGLLDLVQKELWWAERLVLEKIKNGIDTSPRSGIPIVTAYTGYEDEDQKLLIEDYAEET